MRRRQTAAQGPEALARVAQEAAWWAERSRIDVELAPRELARYRALRAQRDDPGATVDAILAASVAAPAVAAALVEDAHREHSLGRSAMTPRR